MAREAPFISVTRVDLAGVEEQLSRIADVLEVIVWEAYRVKMRPSPETKVKGDTADYTSDDTLVKRELEALLKPGGQRDDVLDIDDYPEDGR